MVKKIPLTQGKFALVDDEDFEYLMQWKWYFCNGYAKRVKYLGGGRHNEKKEHIFMHRIINNTPKGILTDHINGDKLDNRKINLRSCTNEQNVHNSRKPKRKNLTSRYKGVYRGKSSWIAQIRINKKLSYIGSFKTEIEAAEAYNNKTLEIRGEFGYLNEIDYSFA